MLVGFTQCSYTRNMTAREVEYCNRYIVDFPSDVPGGEYCEWVIEKYGMINFDGRRELAKYLHDCEQYAGGELYVICDGEEYVIEYYTSQRHFVRLICNGNEVNERIVYREFDDILHHMKYGEQMTTVNYSKNPDENLDVPLDSFRAAVIR